MMRINHKRLNDGSVQLRDRDGRTLDVGRLLAAATAAERSWFVVTVTNRAEKDVDNVLRDLGVEAWLPLKKTDPKRRIGRLASARTAVLAPAFPGYLFVRAAPCAETWALLLRVDGVAGVLGTDGRPFPVRDGIVNKLKKMIDDGALDMTVAARRLKKGETVTIKDGPFAWFEGVVEGYVGKLHVRVLASIFGRQAPITLTLDQIARSD